MKFIAEYGGSAGVGDTASEAYESLVEVYGGNPPFDEIKFYKAAEITVEMVIQEKVNV